MVYTFSLIAERIKEGLIVSKKRGKKLGSPKLEKEKLSFTEHMYDGKEYSIKEIIEGTGIIKGSLYRAINQRNTEVTNLCIFTFQPMAAPLLLSHYVFKKRRRCIVIVPRIVILRRLSILLCIELTIKRNFRTIIK